MNRMRPVHPEEVLREEYKLDAAALARAIGAPLPRARALLAGRAPVTAEIAGRLARALRTSPEFWMNLQRACAAAKRR